MRVSRIHTTQILVEGCDVQLSDETAHYLGKVLRVRPGDTLSLFNGEQGEFLASILSVDKKTITVKLVQAVPCHADPRLPIHLGLGLSRGERMDYAIQKATEAGVSSITPLLTERCEVKMRDDRKENRLQHWERIAISACEQCGRNLLPQILPPQSLAQWVNAAQADVRLVLHPLADNTNPGSGRPASVALLVGPEGGLSPAEVDAAVQSGFSSLQLGPRILRTETAPLAAIAILQARWGDMGVS